MSIQISEIAVNEKYKEQYGWSDTIKYAYMSSQKLNEELIREISKIKKEPDWMLGFRLRALRAFLSMPMPNWGPDLSAIDFDKIIYYAKPGEKSAHSWEDVPDKIKRTFDRLGIPEAERKFLAGAGAQFDSESVYHKIQEQLAKQGVIFCDTDTALKEHEGLFKKHFAKVVPPSDNKFAALNSAVWSGGSFLYVPPGVKVDLPLQAYFRINAQNFGQFERTLIIIDKGAKVHYVEGCTAPVYSTNSLHAAVVEVIAKDDAEVKYTTIQNWSNNVYNLVTKRAHAYARAKIEWVDGNIGSKVSMKYPAVVLLGPESEAEIVSIAWAGAGQNQDTGSKVVHIAPNTKSRILSRSISKSGGESMFRGFVKINKGATGAASHMKCDALILDKDSKSGTIPSLDVNEHDAQAGHEATCSRINEDQLFYLNSRGLAENAAHSMLLVGFTAPFIKKLPMEYAIELNRLLSLEMEGSTA
jgi:Fe-S cluster assembly protein SufB